MKRCLLFSIIFCALAHFPAGAQTRVPQYLKTGKLYTPPPPVHNASPYYKNTTFTRGTVFYDGVKYENQSLAYDVSSDKLVLEDVQYIEVVQPLVGYFTIRQDTLIYKPDATGGIPKGYYEQIHRSAHTSGLARHTKYLKEAMRGTVLERSYEPTVRYYVLLPGLDNYKDIRSEKVLLNMNKDFKKEAKAWLRSRSLRYKSQPKETIRAFLEFYETRI